MKTRTAFIIVVVLLVLIFLVKKYGIENLKLKIDYGEKSFEQEVNLKDVEKLKDIDVEGVVNQAKDQVDAELNQQ